MDEPWRYGFHVYSHPFNIKEDISDISSNDDDKNMNDVFRIDGQGPLSHVPSSVACRMDKNLKNQTCISHHQKPYLCPLYEGKKLEKTYNPSSNNLPSSGIVIRRIRHSEVVLIDQVTEQYGKLWLRIRWPGVSGSVAGYISLGTVDPHIHKGNFVSVFDSMLRQKSGNFKIVGIDRTTNHVTFPKSANENVDIDNDIYNNRYNNRKFILDSPFKLFHESKISVPFCEATGLCFPSSSIMELLPMYDDGLRYQNVSSLSVDGSKYDVTKQNFGEPVFCRICREGIHDVDYSTIHIDNELDRISSGTEAVSSSVIQGENLSRRPDDKIDLAMTRCSNEQWQRRSGVLISSIINDKQYYINGKFHLDTNVNILSPNLRGSYKYGNITVDTHHPYMENPLLTPCECSGSMAFVHYLCVEQWRCHSNHPNARNGLNCETCGEAYTLPPPTSHSVAQNRQEEVVGAGEDDWLEAMPPHVLEALRRPHPWWRMGVAIVRRKWLRPIAPVVMSPIVALYCRTRRTLKKKGVSRRRWACSLCHRRARWKCVRCLRSYYCSRQCQNVSWHIVHKHVCYKPVRFWWSVCLYGSITILFVPDILKYSTIYDVGLSLLFASFLVMSVIGGGMATFFKRVFGLDIRGRALEFFVVVLTIWMAIVNWGLVLGFFGDSSKCVGVMTSTSSWLSVRETKTRSDEYNDLGTVSPLLRMIYSYIFRPGMNAIRLLDRIIQKKVPSLARWICIRDEDDNNLIETSGLITTKCLRMARDANPNFFLKRSGGEKCASDLNTVAYIWLFSRVVKVAVFLFLVLKRRERGRREAVRPRLHQE